MGDHVRKPLEDYVSRLVDSWQISQPLHLRHLSIVKDTVLKGKTQIYIYYTYENFKKLVEGGTGFWEAVKTVPSEVTIGKNFAAALDAKPDVDEYGFPRIEKTKFQGHQNDATLGECVSALNVDPLHISSNDPVLRKHDDGSFGTQRSDRLCSVLTDCDLGVRYKTQQQNSVVIDEPKKAASTLSQATSMKSRADEPQKVALSTNSGAISTKTQAIETEKVTVVKPPRVVPAEVREFSVQTQRRKHVRKSDSKPLGRPRKYPKTGIPANFDTMTPDEVDNLLHSQGMFERYEIVKVEKEIVRRIEDGKDAVVVAYEVLAERDNVRKQEGLLPLPKTSRAQVLHNFAGELVPEPDPDEAEPKSRHRKDTRYRPSMAAHTCFVPALLQQAFPDPKGNDPDKRPPIHRNRTRRRGQRVSDLEPMIYLPSIAAHSWPYIRPPFSTMEITTTDALQNNIKRRQGRQARPKQLLGRFEYLPSIVSHSGSFLPPEILPIARAGQKRKRTAEMPLEKDEKHAISHRHKYLPSIAAQSGSFLPLDVLDGVRAGRKRKRTAHMLSQHNEHHTTPSASPLATQNSVTVPTREASLGLSSMQRNAVNEGMYPGWEKFMSKYYQQQLETITRSNAGVFIGQTTPRRKRPCEPRDFRPAHFKLAVFRSTRLSELDWYVRKVVASEQMSRLGSRTQTPTLQVAEPSAMRNVQSVSEGQPDLPRSTVLPSPALSYLSSQQTSTYITPYADTAGNKRKCTTSPQPIRGADSSDPYSGSQYSRHSSPTMASSKPISKPSTLLEVVALSPANDQVHGSSVIENEASACTPERPPDTKESSELSPNAPVRKDLKPTQTEVATSQAVQSSQSSTQKASKTSDSQPISKINRRGGSVAMLRRVIIMDIIDKCEGVFPSHKEMSSPFAAEWKRRGQEGTPESKTISNAVNALIKENKLRQITFTSQARQGITVTKSMLILPTIDTTDPKVKETQTNMVAYHPRHFIPKAVLPTPDYQNTEIGDNSINSEEASDKTPEQTVQSSSAMDPARLRRVDLAKKIVRGKERAVTARLKVMKEPNQQGLGHADGDELTAVPLIQRATTDAVHAAPGPGKEILPKLTPKRSGGRRGQKRVERLASIKKSVPSQMTPLPIVPANSASNPGPLLWLPSEYAFSDFNFEEPRPTSPSPESPLSRVSRCSERVLLVSFMDPVHYLHRATGTFFVTFSGLRPPRKILAHRGTTLDPYAASLKAVQPYSSYRRNSWPASLQGSQKTEKTLFDEEVDDLLRRELESNELSDAVLVGWPFVNHVFSHSHKTVEVVEADMEATKQVTVRLKDGRLINRRFPRNNDSRPRIGNSIFSTGNRDVDSASAETRTPLKRRRLTTLVKIGTQDEASKQEELDQDHRPNKRRRVGGPRGAKSLGENGEERLLTAVMVIRALTGGLDKRIDWVLVAKVFEPTYTQMFVHSRWNTTLQKYKLALPKIESDFQTIFASAYEEGTVPVIDYDNLEGYDWKWLIEWTMANVDTPTQSLPELPMERSEFDGLYTLEKTSKNEINEFYEIDGSSVLARRMKIVHRDPYVLPLSRQRQSARPKDAGDLTTVKSWIRANIMTPESTYDPSVARAKLSTFPDRTVEDALKQLLLDRVFSQENKGRLIPGRNYDISDFFISRLKKNLQSIHFHRAAAYKQELDHDFEEKGFANYSCAADDGDMIVIVNLLAHRRITIVPIGVPMNKWGHTDGGYETRQMDKRRLNFGLELRPSPTYIYGTPLPPLPAPPSQHLRDPMARIPMWYDIHGSLVPVMWEMALAAVVAVLAMRPGVGALELEKVMRPAMEVWEVQEVLEWLVSAKAAKQVGQGFNVEDEWWWLALGTGENSKKRTGEDLGDSKGRGNGKGKERAGGDVHDVSTMEIDGAIEDGYCEVDERSMHFAWPAHG